MNNERIEVTILRNLMYNEPYMRKSIPFLKDIYFSKREEHILFGEIYNFISKYNNLPTKETILVEMGHRKDLNDDEVRSVKEVLEVLNPEDVDQNWLIDTTEKFCKDRAVHNAVLEGIKILDKGEFLVTLLVTDATGLSDEIETTVLVVEDYHDEQSGNVNGNDDTEEIEMPVNNGVISLRIEYSLQSASISPFEEDTVTLRLSDADGVIIDEETGVGEGDGAWSYTSDDLSSTGDYTFTIESESGSMDFDIIIDLKY